MYRWCFLLGLLAVAWAQSGDDGMARFDSMEAMDARASHHYCLNYGQTEFPNATNRVWTLFVQFPMLSFLDAARKDNLFRIVASLMNSGSGGSLNINESTFCVGTYEAYRLTYYEESVLIHLYFEPMTNPTTDLNTYFDTGYNTARTTSSDTRVQLSLGRYAIAINLEDVRGGPTTDVHPGMNALNPDNIDPNNDPTLRAVVLGYWPGNITLSYALDNQIQRFADNPNPINYGLEGGDIVFAVIGTILTAVVLGLVILGFCIHPFFLS